MRGELSGEYSKFGIKKCNSVLVVVLVVVSGCRSGDDVDKNLSHYLVLSLSFFPSFLFTSCLVSLHSCLFLYYSLLSSLSPTLPFLFGF